MPDETDPWKECNRWRRRYRYPLVGAPPLRLGTTVRDVQLATLPTEKGEAPHLVRVTAERLSFSLAHDPRKRRRFASPDEAVAQVAELARQLIALQLVESLYAFFFDLHGALLGFTEIARGRPNIVASEPSNVLRPTIMLDAHAVILVHNHPSGNPEPSEADFHVAMRMEDWLHGLGVVLAASLVVTQNAWSSILDHPVPSTTDLCSDPVQ